MRIDPLQIKELARQQGLTINELLNRAGVSRTAYYSLLRKDSILPRSIKKLAQNLQVSPLSFLHDPEEEIQKIRVLQEETNQILKKHPHCEREHIFHTLQCLEESPIERLRRGLLRGQAAPIL